MDVFVLLLIGATCRDPAGFLCQRSLDATISGVSAENHLKINVAVGDVVSLELPESVALRGEPALGNRALFDVKVVADPLRILVWPRLPQTAADTEPDAVLGERSNLQIFLDSGVTLAIELRIASVEAAVQQVRFRFPERERDSAYVRQRLAEETQRLEAEFQERRSTMEREIAGVARDRISKGMLLHADCASASKRSMYDLVVLRAHRICRVGNDLFLVFSIQNRSRDLFTIDRIEIRTVGSEDAVPNSRVTFDQEGPLSFDQTSNGVIAWSIDEETASTAEWDLVAFEGAGRQRVVELSSAGF